MQTLETENLEAIKHQKASSPYWQRVDAWTDNLTDRLMALADQKTDLPLFVPITVTFKPMSIRDDEILIEFSRFYTRLTRMIITNPDRPSKKELLPFTVAWRDDPSTRPDKYYARPTALSNYPSFAPHIHALMIVHPALANKFLDVADTLQTTWIEIPIQTSGPKQKALGSSMPIDMPRYRNRSLYADISLAEEIRRLMIDNLAANRTAIRNKIRACVAYSSKLERRSVNTGDVFTVLPN